MRADKIPFVPFEAELIAETGVLPVTIVYIYAPESMADVVLPAGTIQTVDTKWLRSVGDAPPSMSKRRRCADCGGAVNGKMVRCPSCQARRRQENIAAREGLPSRLCRKCGCMRAETEYYSAHERQCVYCRRAYNRKRMRRARKEAA